MPIIREHRPNFRQQAPQEVVSEPAARVETWRGRLLSWLLIGLGLGLVWGRYFWLQVVHGEQINQQAQALYLLDEGGLPTGARGRIYDANGQLLVSNRYIYQLYAQPNQVSDAGQAYDFIAPFAISDPEASSGLRPRNEFVSLMENLGANPKTQSSWVYFSRGPITQDTKEAIDNQPWPCTDKSQQQCLHFERQLRRYYPEGNLAAHVLGYFSVDNSGGNYGIEGGCDLELSGQSLVPGSSESENAWGFDLDGRDIYLTIDRDLQYLVEKTLQEGVTRFGADRGEIIITEPKSGKILAMASYPDYDPAHYYEYSADQIKNPSVINYFEPGSIFKVITMAAAIDTGLIAPGTVCPVCNRPYQIGSHVINNWDFNFNRNITMTQALEKSDNIALSWVSSLLGSERFYSYIKAFGFEDSVETEVQERNSPQTIAPWGPHETATRSFGQAVMVTSLQMVRAVGAIANGGNLMKMTFIDHVVDKATGEVYTTQPEIEREVISSSTAATLRRMMQTAAQHGEAQYIFKNSDLIAGKTGTAQIPDFEHGGYTEDTIASFIGFAPYDDPKFLMLIKYEHPRTSPYAAETSAVTWKELAEKLFLRFDIHVPQD